ncbi:MAG: hypothetical protein LBS60_00775 [Deltaproteobacteria bacterium]|jgi:uncharacterized protein YfaS (alpha-2-macroglobulin family)|nr:hypothetical protein [Deltaproteobacteria bacterium]
MRKIPLFLSLWAIAVGFGLLINGLDLPSSQAADPPAAAPSDPAAEPLKILQFLPNGDVKTLNQIIVSFNQPMVALGQFGAVPPGVLELDPPLPGELRWLNEFTLAFTPTKPVKGSLVLSATLKAGLKSLSGAVLTEEAKIVAVLPDIAVSNAHLIQPTEAQANFTPNLYVSFNQPVDVAVLNQKSAFIYTDSSGAEKKLAATFKMAVDPKLYLDLRYATLTVAASGPIPLGVTYRLVAEPGLVSLVGPRLSTQEIILFEGPSPQPLAVSLSGDCGQTGANPCRFDADDYPWILFNNPVNSAKILDYLVFDPPYVALDYLKTAAKAQSEEPTYVPEYDQYIRFWAPLLGETSYALTIKAGAQDVYGQELKEDQKLYFTTGPLRPFIHNLQIEGFYESMSPAVIPISVANKTSALVKTYLLTPDQAYRFLALRRDYTIDYYERRAAVKRLVNSFGPSKDVTFTPLDGATKKALHFGVDLKKLYGQDKLTGPVLVALNTDQEETSFQLYQFSDLGLTSKIGLDNSLVWVNDLATGAPLAKVDLRLIGPQGQVYWRGQSDDNGLATPPSGQELLAKNPKITDLTSFYLATDYNGQTSLWNVGDSAYFSPWRFGWSYGFSVSPLEPSNRVSWLLTAQPIFAPQETIRFKGILRNLAGDKAQIVKTPKVKLAILKPDRTLLTAIDVPVSALGTFYGELNLPDSPPLGDYSVVVLTNPNYPLNENSFLSYKTPDYFTIGKFLVLNFRAPAFDLTFDPFPEAKVEVPLDLGFTATYHFGSPVANAEGGYMATLVNSPLAFPSLPGYSVVDNSSDEFEYYGEEEWGENPRTLASYEGRLDQAGRLAFQLTVPKGDFPRPRKVIFSAGAKDVDERAVFKQANLMVHPADLYVGLKAQNFIVKAGEKATINVAIVDQKGVLKAETRPVDLKLIRRTYQTVRRRELGATYAYRSEKVDEEIQSLTIEATDGISEVALDIPKPGQYFVQAKIKDQNGQPNQAATSLYALGQESVGWKMDNDSILTLIPDQTEYSPGDTARILVQSPFESAYALMTVERSGIKSIKSFKVDSQTPLLEVPLNQADFPNVFVSLILVRGRVSEALENNVDLGKPTVRVGQILLNVKGNPDLLTVKVTPDKEEYEPRQKVTVKVAVSDYQGQPVTGEVALAVVDAGLVQLTNDSTYFPEREFFQPRPLAVVSANNIFDLIGRRNWNLKGVEPGGGGAAPAPYSPVNILRTNFRNLAHFEPFVKLDKEGKGTVTFELPDNLTTFKIYAVATGQGLKTGTGQSEVLVTQKLLIRTSLPQEVAVGDEFNASVILTNRGPEGQAEVSFKAENLELLEPNDPKKVTIPANSSQEVSYRVKAGKAGPATVAFNAALGDSKDAALFKLPVNYLTQLTTVSAFRELTPGTVDIALALDHTVDPLRGSLTVELAPTLVPLLPSVFEYLDKYKFACLEQTTSRAYGALAMLRVKNWLKTPKKEEDRLKAIITKQLALIQASDNNGAFTLWPEEKRWNRRNPLLTVYIYDFLLTAQKAGFTVSEGLLTSVNAYLLGVVNEPDILNRFYLSDPTNNEAIRLYAVEVLARAQNDMASNLEYFYQKRNNLSLYQLLSLTRGLAASSGSLQSQDQIKELLSLVTNNVHISPMTVSFPGLWLDADRLKALTLLTLAEVDPTNQLLPGLIKGIADQGSKNAYYSTQTRVNLLWGLATYINKAEAEKPNLAIQTTLGPNKTPKVTFKSYQDKPAIQNFTVKDALNQDSLSLTSAGQGRAWASVRLTSAPLNPSLDPIIGNGLMVTRDYSVVKPQPLAPGQTEFQRGQVVKVTVTFMTPIPRYNVMLEDRIPAGFESINFSLKDADMSLIPLTKSDDDGTNGYLWYEHEEFWPNRVLVSASFIPAGAYTYTYLVRPATIGQYLVPGPKVEEMYSPENFGLGAGHKVVIKE